MGKRIWIFVLAAVLLGTSILPIALLNGSDQLYDQSETAVLNDREQKKENSGANVGQGLEYEKLTAGNTVEYSSVKATGSDGETGSVSATSVVKPTITLKSPALEFKDMICIIAFYTVDNTQDVEELGMVTYNQKVDAVDVNTAAYVIPGSNYDEASGRYFSSSQGIHAKYLGDTVYLACYAKLTDGSYVYSKLAPYSAVTYAANQLKNSTDMKLKQLVAAMLNYGAAAQLHFAHNTNALANGSFTAEQKALPEDYRSNMVSVVPAAPAAKQGLFLNNQGFASRKPAISFEGAFCINYFFTPKYVPDSGITLYYWDAEAYRTASALSASNATGKLKLEGSGTGEYRGDITGIAAKQLSEAVYVAAAYKSGGTVWTSGVLGYSIGTYCGSQSTKGGTIADLAMATAVYGYHAKQYFGIQSAEPTIIVGNGTGKSGSEMEVTVDLSNSPELYAMCLKLTFDDAALTLTSAKSGEAMADFVYTEPSQLQSGCNFLWYANNPATGDGTVLQLTFKINPDTAPGTYPITVTCDSGNTYDANDNDVNLACTNGSITVNG